MAKKIYVDPDGLNEYHQKSTEEVDKKLNGDFVENNEFTFRATDGITSIKTGTAYLERIKGNTVKWNQLLRANKLVDMGLPSGTLWATCDIDVTKADKFCETPFTYEKSFFSWGNVDGHNPISNKAFDYDFGSVNSDEPWYEGQPYGETQGNTLTSNIPQSADYDAARHHLCAPWRMPTSAEFNELFANIIYIDANGDEVDTTKADKRVSVNGVMGLYLESKLNGARLFFSCSGYGSGRSWFGRGSSGLYWSSTWNSARRARSLRFSSGGVDPQSYYDRYDGYAIRPVTNSAIVTDENGHKYAVSGKYIIDLTLMYGAGNEPSTIAQFEADYYKWFGKPLTSEDFTQGELRDVKMSAIKTVGFNQWDEEWELGDINSSAGQDIQVTDKMRSKNYIPVLQETVYYFKCNYDLKMRYYDYNKNYLGYSDYNGQPNAKNNTRKTPTGCCYMRFAIDRATTYNHDICINISNAKRNGEYEPHWEETKNVPITTLTGKLNGEGESVIVFPDGMKSVGAVQDDILIENGGTNGIKRIGSNDLGGYNYTKQGNLYTTNFVPANANMISGRGKAVVWNQKVKNGSNKQASGLTTTYLGDLTYKINGTNTALTVQNLFAGDAYIIGHKYFQSVIAISGEVSDSVIFYNGWGARTNLGEENITQQTSAQATNGIIGLQCTVGTTFSDLVVRIQRFDLTQMFGEGNEPTTVEEFRAMFPEDYYEYNTGSLGIVADATYADAASFKASMAGVSLYYELETPLVYELDNFQLPLPYRVDDYGTEEIKGAENSVAPTLDIRYGINIIDTIRNLPKTIDSIEEEISDTNDRIDDAFDDIDTKEDKSTFSHSTSEVPPSTALTFTPNVNTIYYQHESTPVIGNINMVLPIPETERATIKVIYRNSTSDAPTITSEEGVNVIIENNIGGPYRLTTINCEWYHDCWVVDIQTHGT